MSLKNCPDCCFVGDIDDDMSYPFGTYTKKEADEKFALKEKLNQANATIAALQKTIADMQIAFAKLEARVDELEYQPIKIDTFTASPAQVERGGSNTVTLKWSTNKTAKTVTVNGEAVTGNQKVVTVDTTTVFTLAVSDGKTSATKNITVVAANQIYYGASANFDNVTSLAKVLSDDKKRTINVNAGQGEYIIYAYPSRLGNCSFWVEQFEGGFEPAIERELTNSSGYSEMYKLYRSTNPNLGATTVEIKEES